MELRDYLHIIRRRKGVVVLVALCVVVGYSIFFFTQKPTYTSHARIILRLPPEWRDMPVMSMPHWNTRSRLLKSKPVMERSADRLKQAGLDISPGAIGAGLRVNMDESTNFIDIYYEDSTSTAAIKVLRRVAKTFYQYDRENNKSTLTSAEETISEQLTETRKMLQKNEKKLARFRKEQGIHSPEAQLTGNLENLYDINDRKLELQFKREEVDKQLRSYRELLSKQQDRPDTVLPEVEKSQIEEITSTLSQARLDYQNLKQRYGPAHPKIKSIKTRIGNLEEKLEGRVKRHLENVPLIANSELEQKIFELTMKKQMLRVQKQQLARRTQRVNEQISKVSEGQSRLLELKRRIDFAEKRLMQLKNSLDRVRFNKSLLDRSARILSLPESASVQYPTSTRTYGFVLLAGLLLGVGTGSALEYINDKIETKFDVKRYLDLPVLGSIPRMESEQTNLLEMPLKTPLAERYHNISVILEYSLLKKRDWKSVLITSSVPGEGKTVTCLNLGVSLARAGESVLVIDLDLRNPQLHKVLESMNSNGISNLLSGELEIEHELDNLGGEMGEGLSWEACQSVIESTPQSGLDFMPSGPIPSNPIELVRDRRLQRVLSVAEENYGVVLVDGTPLGSVIDSIAISTVCDGALLVARASKVRKGEAQHSKHLLEDVETPILGVVLNDVRYEPAEYYYEYGPDKKEPGTT